MSKYDTSREKFKQLFHPLCNHFVIRVKIATQFSFPLQSVSHSHIFFIIFFLLSRHLQTTMDLLVFRDNISLQFIQELKYGINSHGK